MNINALGLCCSDCVRLKEFKIKQDLFLFIDVDQFILKEELAKSKSELKKHKITIDRKSVALLNELIKKIQEAGKRAFLILFSEQFQKKAIAKYQDILPEVVSIISPLSKSKEQMVDQINLWRCWHQISLADYFIISANPKIENWQLKNFVKVEESTFSMDSILIKCQKN